MKKAIFVNALRGIRYAGEIVILAEMMVHICTFTRQHVIPRLCRNKKVVADAPVVDESGRSEWCNHYRRWDDFGNMSVY